MEGKDGSKQGEGQSEGYREQEVEDNRLLEFLLLPSNFSFLQPILFVHAPKIGVSREIHALTAGTLWGCNEVIVEPLSKGLEISVDAHGATPHRATL